MNINLNINTTFNLNPYPFHCSNCNHINREIYPLKAMRHPKTFEWMCPNNSCKFENAPLNKVCEFCSFDYIDITPQLTDDQIEILKLLPKYKSNETKIPSKIDHDDANVNNFNITKTTIVTNNNNHVNEDEIKAIKKDLISNSSYINYLILCSKESFKNSNTNMNMNMKNDMEKDIHRQNHVEFIKCMENNEIPFSGGFSPFDFVDGDKTKAWVCIKCCKLLHKNRSQCYCGQSQFDIKYKNIRLFHLDQIIK